MAFLCSSVQTALPERVVARSDVMWKKGGRCMGFGNTSSVSGGLSGTHAVQVKIAKLPKPFDEYLVTDSPELDVIGKGKTPTPAE
jgi:hypothetical protein